VDFEEERRKIEKMEAGEEDVEDNERDPATRAGEAEGGDVEADNDEGADLLVVEIGKRKALEFGKSGEVEVETKWVRFATSGLLDFKGPVGSHFNISSVITQLPS
jgi:hypothetical protein